MSTLGEDFLAAAKMLGFEDAEGTISGDDFDELLSDPNIAAFLKWFCDHASDFSVLNRSTFTSDTVLASTVDEVQSPVNGTTRCCTHTVSSRGSQRSLVSAKRSTRDSVKEEFSQLPPIQKVLFEKENRFLDEQIRTQTSYNRELRLIVSESYEKLKKMQKEAIANHIERCDLQLAYKCLSLSIHIRLMVDRATAAIVPFCPITSKDHNILSRAVAKSVGSASTGEVSEILNELFNFFSQEEDMLCRHQHVRDYCNAINLKILSAKLRKAGMEAQLERLKWFNEQLATLSADDLKEFFESVQKSNSELKEEFSSLLSQWRDRLVNSSTDMQMEPLLEAYHAAKLDQFSYWNENILPVFLCLILFLRMRNDFEVHRRSSQQLCGWFRRIDPSEQAVKMWEMGYEPVRRKLTYLRRRIDVYEAALTYVRSVERSLDRIANFASSLQEVVDSCASVQIELEKPSDAYDSLQQCLPAMINEFRSKISDGIISHFFSSDEVKQEMVETFAVRSVMHFNKLLQMAQKELDRLKLEL
ncbi:hypothetical protein D918_05357 [Trichuris suis]|nr:hypothetical protein D918_05357 [Trichuris suis]